MDSIFHEDTGLHPVSKKCIFVNPPEQDGDDVAGRMERMLRSSKKTPEQFQTEIVDRIVAFSQRYAEKIATVLVSTDGEEVKVVFGIIGGHQSEFFDAVSDLGFDLSDAGWLTNCMEFPSDNVAQLIDFSHFEMDGD